MTPPSFGAVGPAAAEKLRAVACDAAPDPSAATVASARSEPPRVHIPDVLGEQLLRRAVRRCPAATQSHIVREVAIYANFALCRFAELAGVDRQRPRW